MHNDKDKKDTLTIYEKPTCATCRLALKELKDAGVEYEKVNYYTQPFTRDGLIEILHKLRMKPRQLLRTREKLYVDLELNSNEYSDDKLISIMLKNPDLIQRPIVVKGNKAILVRPIERLREIL